WDRSCRDKARISRRTPSPARARRRPRSPDDAAQIRSIRAATSPAAAGPAARGPPQLPPAPGRGWAAIANPRVEHGVGEIDDQIDQHVNEAEQQHDALDDRIVAAQDGIDREAADARDREHRFGDHSAADQERNADADYGDD